MTTVGLFYLLYKSTKNLSENLNIINTDLVLVVDDQYHTVVPLIKTLELEKIPFKYVPDGYDAIRELSHHQFRHELQ
jgi:hypothetical protein